MCFIKWYRDIPIAATERVTRMQNVSFDLFIPRSRFNFSLNLQYGCSDVSPVSLLTPSPLHALRGGAAWCCIYPSVRLSQEHHVSLFPSDGDLRCQSVPSLVSGCAERPFVSASVPAGGNAEGCDRFPERETASQRSEVGGGGRKEDV